MLDNYGPGANGTYREEATVQAPLNGAGGLPMVTGPRLDEAITKLLPTHMQLIMGIGTAEELALAEVKAEGGDEADAGQRRGCRPPSRTYP